MKAVPTYRALARALVAHPQLLRVKPSIGRFLLGYLSRFQIMDISGRLIIHSHLPAIGTQAYARFVREHLIERTAGPSHAQIGVTNACPQRCAFCYNRGRTGQVMDTATIRELIRDLQRMGVVWLGFTGGEPLLDPDLPLLVEVAADGCAVKLFTTGIGISRERAAALRGAGLSSVSVSLDHWEEDAHDRSRGYPGAFRAALRAIDIFRETDGLHVGVSAVLDKEMLRPERVEQFLRFLEGLGVHEAWLSEAKPSIGRPRARHHRGGAARPRCAPGPAQSGWRTDGQLPRPFRGQGALRL